MNTGIQTTDLTETIFIDEDTKLAVKKGASWLDENHPDWVMDIDLSRLEMDSCVNCVIGQAVGDYHFTVSKASSEGIWGNWAQEHGFTCHSNYPPETESVTEQMDLNFRQLEVLWTEEVQKRLG